MHNVVGFQHRHASTGICYCNGASAAQSTGGRAAVRFRNLLRQLTAHHDEAGLASTTAVDFKGNFLEKIALRDR